MAVMPRCNLPPVPYARVIVGRQLAAAWLTTRANVARVWLCRLECGHIKRVPASGQAVTARRTTSCPQCAKGRRVQWMRGWDQARADAEAGKVDVDSTLQEGISDGD